MEMFICSLALLLFDWPVNCYWHSTSDIYHLAWNDHPPAGILPDICCLYYNSFYPCCALNFYKYFVACSPQNMAGIRITYIYN